MCGQVVDKDIMYSLHQIRLKNPIECPQINAFYEDIPKHPYCTNDKGFCYIRAKKQAFKHAYIQPNTPFKVRWLVYDLDYPSAIFAYYDNLAPSPQLIIRNPANMHAHYAYKLTYPVALMGDTNPKAIDYLEAIYTALRHKIHADPSYSGNLIKNPAHPNWETYTTSAPPSYTLEDLALNLDLTQIKKSANDGVYFGRNHEVFERTRHKAYKIAHKYDFDRLYREILAIANAFNAEFTHPMQPREIHWIATSITRFCKSERFGRYSEAFFAKQAEKGRKGGLKSDSSQGGLARSALYTDKRDLARVLREQGENDTKIAKMLGISRRTLYNWFK